jgi:hypothetical protein
MLEFNRQDRSSPRAYKAANQNVVSFYVLKRQQHTKIKQLTKQLVTPYAYSVRYIVVEILRHIIYHDNTLVIFSQGLKTIMVIIQ